MQILCAVTFLTENLLPDDSFGTDELDDFAQPFRLIDAFSTDDLIDFEDYVSDRFDPSISEDTLNRMYPHFAGHIHRRVKRTTGKTTMRSRRQR